MCSPASAEECPDRCFHGTMRLMKGRVLVVDDDAALSEMLGIMLPGIDGIDGCRQIRTESGVPIVMLTAKSDTVDVVLGLESGADDYIVKPFQSKVLIARVRARLRRPA